MNTTHFNKAEEVENLPDSCEKSKVVVASQSCLSTVDSSMKQYEINKIKRVRFREGEEAEVNPVVIHWSDISDGQRARMWWRDDEYLMMKENAKYIAKAIRESYTCNRSYFDYAKVFFRMYHSRMNQVDPGRIDEEIFKLWIAAGHTWRGLEFWSVPGLWTERRNNKRMVYQSVLKVYKNTEGIGIDPGMRHEIVRVFYEKIASPGKLLAQDFGIADEFAVKFDAMFGNHPPIEEELRLVLPPELYHEIVPGLGQSGSAQASTPSTSLLFQTR